MNFSEKIMEKDYNKHLEAMKDGYLNLFRDGLRRKFEEDFKLGPFHDAWRSVENIFDGDSDKDLNNIPYNNFGAEDFVSHNNSQGGIPFPFFARIKLSDFNSYFKSEEGNKGPSFIVFVDEMANIEKSQLRRELFNRINYYNDHSRCFQTNINLTSPSKKKIDYGIFIANIIDTKYDFERKKIYPNNLSSIDDLIKESILYRKIVSSREFKDEEENIEKSLRSLSKLFYQNDGETMKDVLDYLRLGENINIEINKKH